MTNAGAAIECIDLTKHFSGAAPARPAWPGAGGPPGGGGNGWAPGGAPPLARPEGGILAVDKLNITVPAGEFFGLLGPNGAGKTTTIGMLTTRVRPTSGRAIVAGIDVVASPALARRYLAAVTQTNTLDRGLSIFDNLFFHGRYFGLSRGESRRRAGQLLEKFQLADRASESVDALSGGLAQRVQIARALLHEPRVLFLDEPTAGLDPQSRFQLWQTLQQLNKDGQTIVLTTHYMDEAEQLCERLAIMDHGHLLALDTPPNLKAMVKADRFIVLTLSQSELGAARAAVERIEGVHRVEEGEKGALRVFSKASPGLTGSVVTAVTNAGAEIRDLSVTEPTLETVFLELTGKEYRE